MSAIQYTVVLLTKNRFMGNKNNYGFAKKFHLRCKVFATQSAGIAIGIALVVRSVPVCGMG